MALPLCPAGPVTQFFLPWFAYRRADEHPTATSEPSQGGESGGMRLRRWRGARDMGRLSVCQTTPGSS